MTHSTGIMLKWFDIGPIEQIPKRGARVVKTPRRDIAIFRTASDEVFALKTAARTAEAL